MLMFWLYYDIHYCSMLYAEEGQEISGFDLTKNVSLHAAMDITSPDFNLFCPNGRVSTLFSLLKQVKLVSGDLSENASAIALKLSVYTIVDLTLLRLQRPSGYQIDVL
jgi:hypothetical protein